MEQVKLNLNGVNANIKAHILNEQDMRKIGFTYHSKDDWYFCKKLKFPKKKKYRGLDITFNVSIPKNGSDISIDILDEDFLQPYDYQSMLIINKDSFFVPSLILLALITRKQVEKWMSYLQEKGVLSGHIEGEYI